MFHISGQANKFKLQTCFDSELSDLYELVMYHCEVIYTLKYWYFLVRVHGASV